MLKDDRKDESCRRYFSPPLSCPNRSDGRFRWMQLTGEWQAGVRLQRFLAAVWPSIHHTDFLRASHTQMTSRLHEGGGVGGVDRVANTGTVVYFNSHCVFELRLQGERIHTNLFQYALEIPF